jgi:hypothetical protein
MSHDREAQAALNEARHAAALKALSPSEVLAPHGQSGRPDTGWTRSPC